MINKKQFTEFLLLSFILIIILVLVRFSPINIFYNHTSSMPKGWYIVNKLPFQIKRGDLIAICLHDNDFINLAIDRKYLTQLATSPCPQHGEILFKRVLGVESDHYKVQNNYVYINNTLIPNSKIHFTDHNHLLLPHIESGILSKDQLLVFGATNDSLDSRYFGVMYKSDVIGYVYNFGK